MREGRVWPERQNNRGGIHTNRLRADLPLNGNARRETNLVGSWEASMLDGRHSEPRTTKLYDRGGYNPQKSDLLTTIKVAMGLLGLRSR
jgi:hypothetical protein